MKAAVVFDLAEGPVWADFIDPQPAPGQTLIDVRAAAISHVVKASLTSSAFTITAGKRRWWPTAVRCSVRTASTAC